MYKLHTVCRACGHDAPSGIKAEHKSTLVPVFDLGLQPLANDFRKDHEEHAGFFPLKLLYCEKCSLAQLSIVVNPTVLYAHYSYVTSPSETMHKHLQRVADDLDLDGPYDSVLEIGSNDGLFLKMLADRGKTVRGIDPAENLCQVASERGVPVYNTLFNESSAERIVEMYPERFDVVIARHVFCHIDDWRGTMRALEMVTHSDSLVFIEVPCTQNQIAQISFDQIYHEHLSHMTVQAMEALCHGTAFQIARVIHYEVHGGSVGIILRRRERKAAPELIWNPEEKRVTREDWAKFAKESSVCIHDLAKAVVTLREHGHSVAGLGASAKSTVWANACRFTRKDIAFIADETKQKWFTTSPGTDIPIVDEGALVRDRPEYVILFAWNYAREILDKHRLLRDRGMKFIIPIPKLEIV